ncbi:MAG: NUDIX hydrolase [Candidatus Dormiibacter spiritus]|nr:MAG: NUDIX hydrolase [Candidatus Dormibacteraeota bacterium]
MWTRGPAAEYKQPARSYRIVSVSMPASYFCLNCGIPLEPQTREGREVEGCQRCGFVLWHDPKVVTVVVVENDRGELVLGRRGIDPGYGRWCLPGGFVNDDEDPAEAAARECWEEVCAHIDITRLLNVYHVAKEDAPSLIGIAYSARLREGEIPQPGEEMLEVAAFATDVLPELAFPSHFQAVRDYLAAREEVKQR